MLEEVEVYENENLFWMIFSEMGLEKVSEVQ